MGSKGACSLVWPLAAIVVGCFALPSALADNALIDKAPNTANFLQQFLRSEAFTTAIQACFPNATAPSQCLLNDQLVAESVTALANGMATSDIIIELTQLAEEEISIHLMWDFDYEGPLIATFAEIFRGGSQYQQGTHSGGITPGFWITPSPIGRLARSPSASLPGAPTITLGSTCSEKGIGGHLSLELDFRTADHVGQGHGPSQSMQTARRRLLQARPVSSPNVTNITINVRVAEPGPSVLTGFGPEPDVSHWENQAVVENLERSDTQVYPGQPYPRNHLLLFYRADWFKALNLSIPNTWDELISLAEALPGIAGFEGSSRKAGPEDFPDWNFNAFPNLEFTPVEPQKVWQVLPQDMMGPKERAASNSSLPRYALCLDLAARCKGSWLFDAIFASLAQARGIWQGAFIDPIDTQLLGQKEPELVKEALRIFHRVAKASHQPTSAHSCAIVNPMFASGACAMTFEWDVFFPYFYNEARLEGVNSQEESEHHSKELVGNLGVAPVPGSTRVYDRKQKQMVNCDVASCPMATRETVAEYESVQASNGTSGLKAHFSDVLVNRAPYSVNIVAEVFFCNVRGGKGDGAPGLDISGIDAASRVMNGIVVPIITLEGLRGQVLRASFQAMGPEVLRQAYSLVTKHDVDDLEGLYQNHPALVNPPEFPSQALQSWWAPNVSSSSPLNLGALSGKHINVNDSTRYFNALWKARYSYRNQAPELWVTRLLTLAYRHAVDEIAVYATASPDFSLQAGAEYFRKRCNDSRAAEVRNTETVQGAIFYTTGFDESMIDAPPDEGSRDWVAGAIAGPVVAAVLLCCCLTLAVFAYKHKTKTHRNWLGKVVPPKAGPATTLMCTDIEGSTQMWEMLPEDTCDKAIDLHNEVIRSLLSTHRGYECGTEGDAFILAFHTAEDAVMFSSEAQLRLMLAPWPKELFYMELFQPVYVQPNIPQKLNLSLDRSKKGLTVQFEATGSDDPSVRMGQGFDRGSLLPAPPPPPSSFHSQQDLDTAEQESSEDSGSRWFHRLQTKLSRLKPAKQKESVRPCGQEGLTPRRYDGSVSLKGRIEDRRDLDTRESPGLSGLLSMDAALMDTLRSEVLGGPGAMGGGVKEPPSLSLLNPQKKNMERKAIPSCSSVDTGIVLDLDSMALTQVDLLPSPAGAVTPSSMSDRSQAFLNPTIGQRMQVNVPKADGPGPGRLLVLRGLRVRMGMGTGVEDVQLNRALGRLWYSGRAMVNARAVVDAAKGGQTLIGPETFQQLPPQQGKVFVVSMGEHVLKHGPQDITLQLYQVLPSMLCARAPHLGPVRSLRPLSLDFLCAPANAAAVCFMSVSCLHALRLWNPEVTCRSLALYHSTVQSLLTKRGGYLVEASDGLCLTAFTQPAAAIRWAVESLEACMHADWPAELLNDELGEEQRIPHPRPSRSELHNVARSFSTKAQVDLQEKLVFRGLRLKVGIDWGSVKADIHPATARVSFRGKVMNRAARVSCLAKSGQVLCTERAWSSTLTEYNVTESEIDGKDPGVSAYFVGSPKLKGIQETINLYQCIGSES